MLYIGRIWRNLDSFIFCQKWFQLGIKYYEFHIYYLGLPSMVPQAVI